MKRACSFCLFLVVFLSGIPGYGQQAETPRQQQIAVLTSDASPDETQVIVDTPTGIPVDKDLVLESRDGKVRETIVVKHVYGNNLILKDKLKKSFLSGSKLYQ